VSPFLAWVVAKVLDSIDKAHRRARYEARRSVHVRRAIDARTRRQTLRYGCRWPGGMSPYGLRPRCPFRATHVHHRVPVSEGGTNDTANLIGLCVNHHRWVHGGGKQQAIRSGVLVTRR
jgi:hypothetical protein